MMVKQRRSFSSVNRVLVTIVVGIGIGFVVAWKTPDVFQARQQRVKEILRGATDSVRSALSDFVDHASQTHSIAELASLRASYERTRHAWKRLEPQAEYSDPAYISQHINGAPLPRLDVKSQYVDVLPPVGLQIIDELLFAEDSTVIDSIVSIRALVATLQGSMNDVVLLNTNIRWTDRMVLESCRSGLIRITSMGITGFDRPASEPVVQDDIPTMTTIADLLQSFQPELVEHGHTALSARLDSLIDTALFQLSSADSFSLFDRAEFIRTALDPLYGITADIQKVLGIEFADEALSLAPPLDPRSRSMFSTTSLDPFVGSGLLRSSSTRELRELGRMLFFDPVLSVSADRACASCHDPARAFTDGMVKSVAFEHQGSVKRNAPTLINAVYARRFFHDLRASRISEVISHVVTDSKEFAHSLFGMVDRLNESVEYQHLFSVAFKEDARSVINSTNVSLAIASYLTTLVSFDSPVDRYLRGEPVTLDSRVRKGFNLFMGSAACGTCHFAPSYSGYVPPAFTDSESEILGVPTKPDTSNAILDPDVGRFGGNLRDGSAIFKHSFKTPTIRNVQLTAPYMHNGAFPTLRDVVTFYDKGGGKGIGIDISTQTLAADRLEFAESDYEDLIAFMNALTDTTGLTERPTRLPLFNNQELDRRPIGGAY